MSVVTIRYISPDSVITGYVCARLRLDREAWREGQEGAFLIVSYSTRLYFRHYSLRIPALSTVRFNPYYITQSKENTTLNRVGW